MLKTALSLALILTLFTARVAFGQDFFVSTTGSDTNGNDTNNCTNPVTPCLTIQHAVDSGAGKART